MSIQFEDNSMEVKEALNAACIAWLYEAAQLVEGKVADNTPVDTGQLKGSWDHKVEEGSGKATVGSPIENAIWNEFGTGQYALHGDGRKTPWKYQNAKGEWYTTSGKRPQRSLHNAFEALKIRLQTALENKLKGL